MLPNKEINLVEPFPDLVAHFSTLYQVTKALNMHASSVYAYAQGKQPMGPVVRQRVYDLLDSIRQPKSNPQADIQSLKALIVGMSVQIQKISDYLAQHEPAMRWDSAEHWAKITNDSTEV